MMLLVLLLPQAGPAPALSTHSLQEIPSAAPSLFAYNQTGTITSTAGSLVSDTTINYQATANWSANVSGIRQPTNETGKLQAMALLVANDSCPLNNGRLASQEQMFVKLDTFWYVFLAIITTIGLLVSFVSNMIIIYLFSRTPSLRQNPSNLVAVNLSLSDLLYCIQWPSIIYSSITQSTRILEIDGVCKIFGFITSSTASASILTVLVMSVERAIVITNSLQAKNCLTIRTAWLIIVVIWIASFATSLPPLFDKYNRYTLDPSKTSCTLDYLSSKSDYKLYVLALYVVYWILPAIIISISYALIIVAFKRSSISLQRMADADLEQRMRPSSSRRTLSPRRCSSLSLVLSNKANGHPDGGNRTSANHHRARPGSSSSSKTVAGVGINIGRQFRHWRLRDSIRLHKLVAAAIGDKAIARPSVAANRLSESGQQLQSGATRNKQINNNNNNNNTDTHNNNGAPLSPRTANEHDNVQIRANVAKGLADGGPPIGAHCDSSATSSHACSCKADETFDTRPGAQWAPAPSDDSSGTASRAGASGCWASSAGTSAASSGARKQMTCAAKVTGTRPAPVAPAARRYDSSLSLIESASLETSGTAPAAPLPSAETGPPTTQEPNGAPPTSTAIDCDMGVRGVAASWGAPSVAIGAAHQPAHANGHYMDTDGPAAAPPRSQVPLGHRSHALTPSESSNSPALDSRMARRRFGAGTRRSKTFDGGLRLVERPPPTSTPTNGRSRSPDELSAAGRLESFSAKSDQSFSSISQAGPMHPSIARVQSTLGAADYQYQQQQQQQLRRQQHQHQHQSVLANGNPRLWSQHFQRFHWLQSRTDSQAAFNNDQSTISTISAISTTNVATAYGKSNCQLARTQVQIRLAKMSFYLILLWLVSWTPIASLAMINSVMRCHQTSATAIFLANTMTKLGPAFDVFIYGLSHPKIKCKFKQIIKWMFVIGAERRKKMSWKEEQMNLRRQQQQQYQFSHNNARRSRMSNVNIRCSSIRSQTK